jgi:hypothetical protein
MGKTGLRTSGLLQILFTPLLKMRTLSGTKYLRNIRLAVAAIFRGGWVSNRPR